MSGKYVSLVKTTLQEKNANEQDMISLIEIAVFLEQSEETVLTEGLKLNFKGILDKMGLHAHKGSSGLIQTLAKVGTHVSKIIFHAFKARNNEDSKIKLQELLKKKGSKEEIIHFLLQLDQVTLHMVTGPIHIIDALTGWHIGAKIKDKAMDGIARVKHAQEDLEKAKKSYTGEIVKKIQDIITRLKGHFPALA